MSWHDREQDVEGVVTLVQESRFQLVDDDGIAHLFILAHGAASEPSQLALLGGRQARIRVFYEPAPNLIARIAYRIESCPQFAGTMPHERPSPHPGAPPVEPR